MDGWMLYISGFLCFSPFLNISAAHYLDYTGLFLYFLPSGSQNWPISELNLAICSLRDSNKNIVTVPVKVILLTN